eukprot:1161695-Pelagomonas_calceolata.AAC.1
MCARASMFEMHALPITRVPSSVVQFISIKVSIREHCRLEAPTTMYALDLSLLQAAALVIYAML